MAFLVTGQLIAGMVVDRVGFLGVAVREISTGRIAGALLLLVGRRPLELQHGAGVVEEPGIAAASSIELDVAADGDAVVAAL